MYIKILTKLCVSVFLFTFLCNKTYGDFNIVQNGSAVTAIVIPDSALPVVQYAAQELQYHIQKSTGATLGIFNESGKPSGFAGLIYLGNCNATVSAGIDVSNLAANGFIIKTFGVNCFLAGSDSEGEVLGMLHTNYTKCGTLFAVYEFLDVHMGVRWLWPGEVGEVIPNYNNISTSSWNQTREFQLLSRRLRDYGWRGVYWWKDQQAREDYYNAQSVWLRRHRFALGKNIDYGHGFIDYWERFNSTHTEYFNLLPDGTRRNDPYYVGGSTRPDLVCMSIAEPNLWVQIIQDYPSIIL